MKMKALVFIGAMMAGAIAQAASLAVSQPGISSGGMSWSSGVGSDLVFGAGSATFGYDDLSIQGPAVFIFGAADGFIVGDEFGLLLDGAATPWDVTGTTSGGYFWGAIGDSLTAGPHTLDLVLTAAAPGHLSGSGYWKLGSSPVGEVPLPASAYFLLTGLAGLVTAKRRAAKA